MTTTRTSVLALLLQVGAGITALAACLQLFSNWADAYVAFLGETATVEAHHVRTYQVWVGIAVASLAAVALGAWARGGSRVVPVLLGVVCAVCAVLFSVSRPETAPPRPAAPSGNPNACYSGSNDCPGG